MPDFDNFRKTVLCQGEPKRVPQFDGTVAQDIKEQWLGRPIDSLEDEVEFWMSAGYDFVPLTCGFRQTMRGEKGGIMGTNQYHSSLLTAAEAQYNPFKEGKTTRMWANESEGVITDMASLEAFEWPDPDTAYDYDNIEKIGRLLPDGAKMIINVGYVFTAPSMLMSLEKFCISSAQGDPVVAELIRRVGETQLRVVENLLEFDCVGVVRMPDDLAYTGGTLVSPNFLREYVFPWNKRIGKLVRDKGLLYMYHSDGRLWKVLDDLVDCGFHSIHPCEPASMDIDEVKRKYGGRLCICGNINLDSTLTLGTPDDVVEEVKLRLRTVGPGGGYCCGTSNSVPEYVPFANYKAMVETVQRFGAYPINV